MLMMGVMIRPKIINNRDSMDERNLIRGVIACDSQAQDEFFNLYRPRIYRSCVHLLGFQDGEAEDIVRETFLIALKKLPDFDSKHKLITWLTQIAMNLCYERIRSRKRLILMLEKDIEAMNDEKMIRSAADSAAGRKTEKPAMLRRLSRQLGRICGKLLDLRDRQNRSYAEVARKLRIPIGAVIARLHRCREMLKRRMELEMEKET